MCEKKNLLVIDSCIRNPAVSRTYKLCQMFLEGLPNSYNVNSVILREENLQPYLEADIKKRNDLVEKGSLNDPMFRYARQFASADRIVIAAPYWENTFPSLLRIYLEQVSAPGICFGYENNHPVGLCQAKKLLYLTTVGGFIPNGRLLAEDFLKELCNLFGIHEVYSLAAEGLDIQGNDPDQILKGCLPRLKELLKNF